MLIASRKASLALGLTLALSSCSGNVQFQGIVPQPHVGTTDAARSAASSATTSSQRRHHKVTLAFIVTRRHRIRRDDQVKPMPASAFIVEGRASTRGSIVSLRLKSKWPEKPSFISPSTMSVAVVVNGGIPEVQNVGANVPGCTQLNAYQIECSVPADAPVGTDSFDVQLWDKTDGAGNILGVGSVTADVTGIPSDVISIDIHGVVASIDMSIPLGYSSPASLRTPHGAQLGGPLNCGASRSLPLTVKGYDADKNLITGGITYYNPITLSGDSALTFTTNTVTAPTTSVALSFSGAPTTDNAIHAAAGPPPNGGSPAVGSLAFDPQNYWPLNATYVYDGFTSTIRPATSYPPNYFGTGVDAPMVDLNSIPSGVCDVSTTTGSYVNGRGYDETDAWDNYVGLSTVDGKTAVVVYLTFENDFSSEPQTYQAEWYYPIPHPIDLLPEAAGDTWSADPTYIAVSNVVDGLGGQYDWEDYRTPTNDCVGYLYQSELGSATFPFCDGSTIPNDIYVNNGPQPLDPNCSVGPGIPTTANEITSNLGGSPSWARTTSYDADGIGPVCLSYLNSDSMTGMPAYEMGSNSVWISLQSYGAGPSGARPRAEASLVQAQGSSLTPNVAPMSSGPFIGAGLRAVTHAHLLRRAMCERLIRKMSVAPEISGSAEARMHLACALAARPR
jgi:hypothetical protein